MTDEELCKVAMDHGFGPAMLAMGTGAVAGKPENLLPMLRAIEREALERAINALDDKFYWSASARVRELLPAASSVASIKSLH
jgi:hypothetical protein